MKRTLLILCALLAMAYSAGTQAQNVWDGTVAGSFAGGNGTAEDPYQIADGAQLARFASMVNGGQTSINGKLTADILLNDTEGWENWGSTDPANTWTPIGSGSQPFTGTLDGDGHSVSGIYINSGADCQGLVGVLGEGGTLQNLGVKASYIKGGNGVGGVCGDNSGTVTNCYNTGNVEGNSAIGGVCGMNWTTVTHCYNTGSVTGILAPFGGVCGFNNGGTVTNCYYLNTCGAAGDGTSKTADEFASGEVAWLLQGEQEGQVWGQTIGTDDYPVLGGEKVLQIGNGYVNELKQDGDGFYLISTADELRLFASMVNGGQTSINGRLTADILLNDTEGWENWGSTAPANTWTPIGSDANRFTGTLDGNGHSVSGIYINSTADYQGLVGYLGSGGTLQNVGVKASYIKGGYYVGGLCGYNDGTVTNCCNSGSVAGNFSVGGVCGENYTTVTNCYNTGNVTGTYNVGSVCGSNSGTVTNCYNTGSVKGTGYEVGGVCGTNWDTVTNCYNSGTVEGNSQVGGLCGRNGGTVTNCYYLTGTAAGGINGSDAAGQAEAKTETEFASGEVAWLLSTGKNGEIWGQNLTFDPKDSYPVLGGLKVVQNEDGTSYKNELSQDGDFYLISTADELRLFASMVNGGQTSINGRLTADILLNDTTNWTSWESTAPANSWTPIGSDANQFKGTLDGDGHSVSGIYINSEADFQGLVGYNGGTLQNLGVKASYIKGGNGVGGVCGSNSGTVSNCYNTGSVEGNNSVGGLYGWNNGIVSNCYNTGSVEGSESGVGGVCGENYATVTNCYNTANVTGTGDYTGGVCGINSSTVNNCYNTGKVTGTNNVGGLCGRNEIGTNMSNCYNTGSVEGTYNVGSVCGMNFGTVSNCYNTGSVAGSNQVGGVCGYNESTVANCYYLTGTATGGIGEDYNNGEATEKTADEFASGEVAWLLSTGENGEIWGQNLTLDPKDSYPVLGGEKVYQYSDGTYGNTPLQAGEDGFYLISNADELRRFADMVNGGQPSIKGKLTADIVLNDIDGWESWNESTTELNSWTPIGSSNQPFTGTLDGDGHSVSGIYINSEADNQGLVGCLGEGGTLQNLGVKASYIKGGYSVGGLCGQNSGTVTNCYNTGSVEGNNSVGGLCGWNYGTVTNCYNTGSVEGSESGVGGVCGENYATVTNCYNSGNVTGNNQVGGLCGTNWDTVTNCYNTGTVAGSNQVGGVCGWNYGTVTNCYYLAGTANSGIGFDNGTSEKVEPKEAEQFASGEVAWLLQGEKAEQVWGQTIGTEEYPVLGGEKVLQIGNGYVNELKQDGDFYLISTADELRLFASMVNGGQTSIKGKLTADILLNDISDWESWNESTTELNSWTPIGSSNQPFSGTLDGDGHSVSGIYINSTEINQGLVGYLGSGGTLQNLGVKASYIKGGYYVGGLCGWNYNGSVTNCYNAGSVTGTERVGGVCGGNYDGTVTNCYNTGSVTGTGSTVGGLCGWNYDGTVTNCYNTGSVTGTESTVGGLCGWNYGTVNNCYNTGTVAGYSYVGGVCGDNNYGIVTNCYYLNTCGAAGEGTSKTADEFKSGEVAYLLNGSTSEGESLAWYQNLGEDQTVDDYPVLTADEAMRVYQLTLTDGGNATAFYANSGNFTLPAPAGREGYTFAGWFTAQADGEQMQDNATLTADITLYAQWTANTYTVTFEANGGEGSMNQQTFTYDVAQTLTPNAFTRTGYSFTGWNTQADGNGSTYGDEAEILNLTTEANGSITLYAQWSINSYTIRFVNADGTVLQSSEVEYGQRPAYNGEIPTKESTAEFDYAFAGWDPEIAIVTGNATYTATYTATKRSYTITFVDEDGTELQSSEVEYGQTPAYNGETPTKESTAEFDYTFAGWTPGIATVTGNATYTATYTETRRSYTITFVDEDGTELQSSEVEYGQTPAYNGETPTKESTAEFDYTFAGWDPEIDIVTGDATYTATYTETRRSYTVTLALADGCEDMGEVSGGGSYEYGTQVTLTATANEGYTFVQWSDGDTNATRTITVTGDLMLTATFTATNPTALHTPEAGTWKAIGTDGMLRITGTEAEMTVYDMRGALVYRGNARTIHVTAGAYIVRIGNEVQKAIVK